MAISTYLSIITLNVNGPSAPIKRQRVAEWLQNKTQIYVACKGLTSELKPLMGEWIKKWFLYTVEYYSAVNNEILRFATSQMKLEGIRLSE